jgi:hypothetical protein
MSLCFGFPNIALTFVLFWDELPPTLPDAIVIPIKRMIRWKKGDSHRFSSLCESLCA